MIWSTEPWTAPSTAVPAHRLSPALRWNLRIPIRDGRTCHNRKASPGTMVNLAIAVAGDIGQHFPDTDDKYENIDSSVLLEQVDQLLKKDKYAVGNIDITIIAESPRMAPHIPEMSHHLADVLSIAKTQINIKATTTESLGFAGRKEGIAVHAVVMLYRMTV